MGKYRKKRGKAYDEQEDKLSTSAAITAIIEDNGFSPYFMVGEQTAYEALEGAIQGVLDRMEESGSQQ
jgi:hypothetical protein